MSTYLWYSLEKTMFSSPPVVVIWLPELSMSRLVMLVEYGLKLMAQMIGLSVSLSGVRSGARTI